MASDIVERWIDEARNMQLDGQYIRGQVFHGLVAEITKLRTELAEANERAGKVGVPDGWRLVPVEPTEAMMDAAIAVTEKPCFPQDIYAAMLTAAPAPAVVTEPAAEGEEAGLRADLEAAFRTEAPTKLKSWHLYLADIAVRAVEARAHPPASDVAALTAENERLEGVAELAKDVLKKEWVAHRETHDRATAAEAKVKTMAAALEPFTDIDVEGCEDMPAETRVVVKIGERVTDYTLRLTQFRRAREALRAGTDGEKA